MALVSISNSSILGSLCLNSGVHVQFQEDMYSNSIFFSFDLSWGFEPTYSIPKRYMHKYGGDLRWKAHLRGFLIMHRVFLVFLTHKGVFFFLAFDLEEVFDDV